MCTDWQNRTQILKPERLINGQQIVGSSPRLWCGLDNLSINR